MHVCIYVRMFLFWQFYVFVSAHVLICGFLYVHVFNRIFMHALLVSALDIDTYTYADARMHAKDKHRHMQTHAHKRTRTHSWMWDIKFFPCVHTCIHAHMHLHTHTRIRHDESIAYLDSSLPQCVMHVCLCLSVCACVRLHVCAFVKFKCWGKVRFKFTSSVDNA